MIFHWPARRQDCAALLLLRNPFSVTGSGSAFARVLHEHHQFSSFCSAAIITIFGMLDSYALIVVGHLGPVCLTKHTGSLCLGPTKGRLRLRRMKLEPNEACGRATSTIAGARSLSYSRHWHYWILAAYVVCRHCSASVCVCVTHSLRLVQVVALLGLQLAVGRCS